MIRLTRITIVLGLLALSSCAKLAQVDKSMVNHDAMDLSKDMSDSTSAAFTTLNGGNGPSAGCAT